MAFVNLSPARGTSLVLLTTCLGVLVAQIDTSIVNLAAERIGRDLHAGVDVLQWVLDAYNLVYASLLLSGGMLGDLYGRRRIFAWGVGLFTCGSLVCALAPGTHTLVAGRALTGLGAALEFPTSLAILAAAYPDAGRRAHAIGIWASCNGLAFVIGPALGGLLVEVGGWRSMFLVVVPVSLLALGLAFTSVRETAQPADRRPAPLSQALVIVGLGALSFAVIEAPTCRWNSPVVLACAALFLACAVAFVARERRTRMLIPPQIFVRPAFAAALTCASLMTFGIYAMLFLVPLSLQAAGGASAVAAGLALVPMSFVFFLVSQCSGKFTRRVGPRVPMVAGMTCMGLGLGLLALEPGAEIPALQAALVIIGIGLGLNTGPVLAVAIANAPASRSGAASGLVNTARMIGATLGVAVLGALFAASSGSAAATAGTMAAGLRPAYLGGAAAELAGALVAFLFIRANSLDHTA